MGIQEAIDLCANGDIFIAVRSRDEKQSLIDVLHDLGYSTGCAMSDTYRAYPYCAPKEFRNLDEPTQFTFWPNGSSCTRSVVEFHDRISENTPIVLDTSIVSDLL